MRSGFQILRSARRLHLAILAVVSLGALFLFAHYKNDNLVKTQSISKENARLFHQHNLGARDTKRRRQSHQREVKKTTTPPNNDDYPAPFYEITTNPAPIVKDDYHKAGNKKIIDEYDIAALLALPEKEHPTTTTQKPEPVELTFTTTTTKKQKAKKSAQTLLLCPPWPNLELFLPVAPTEETINELRDLFLPSFTLFWPINQSNTSLLLVADEEKKTKPEQIAINKMVKENPYIPPHLQRVTYNTMPLYYQEEGMKGHDRQQWLMFWADNFTTAEYVGFLDTDTVFVSRVALPDLFDPETMRPVMRPLYGEPHKAAWEYVPHSTEMMIGRKSPFFCMTYFPVIIKVAHLAPMREHIRRTTRMNIFDDSFYSLQTMLYGQFDVMCSYLWYFKRDEYIWAIGQRDPFWKGPIPKGQVANMDEAGIMQTDLDNHGPRVAMHWGLETKELLQTFKKGVCLGMLDNDTNRPNDCVNYLGEGGRTGAINLREWIFEGYTLTLKNDTWALWAHRRRLAINDKCPHDWNIEAIHNLDETLSSIYAAEKMRPKDDFTGPRLKQEPNKVPEPPPKKKPPKQNDYYA